MAHYDETNTFPCSDCGMALVPLRYAEEHRLWHTSRHRLPFQIPDGAAVQTTPEYGVEFFDEPADGDVHATLHDAQVSIREWQETEAPENLEGMRIMVRTHTVIVGPWVPARSAP